jgi:glycosyltransferase involved in cell wall biosynthesis
VAPVPTPPDAGRRKQIGFFGQITRFKGVDILLEAMKILDRQNCGVQLQLRGAGLERNSPEFQEKIGRLLKEASGSVSFTGRYHRPELPGLLAAVDWVIVPSIWWENSPLVIQEALMYGRPIICSGVGGMAEKVRNGIDGLHFAVGDPQSLADAIRRATSTPELWGSMRSQITGAHPMDQHLATISRIYGELLDQAAPQAA